jgi:hypothetical protein
MLQRISYAGRAVSLFFRLFVFRSLKVMFLPGAPLKGKHSETPLVISKLQRRPYIAAAAFLVMMLLLPAIVHGLGIDPVGYSYYPFCLVLTFVAGGFAVLRWVAREIRGVVREVHDSQYCLCLACGYCLKGLPASHQCPECGTPYDIEEVRRKWAAYLADRAARQVLW